MNAMIGGSTEESLIFFLGDHDGLHFFQLSFMFFFFWGTRLASIGLSQPKSWGKVGRFWALQAIKDEGHGYPAPR